jgi:TRAP-type mannitol/chloroaromatic compound transport system permease small subunit
MRIIVRATDSISEWTGKIVRWACVALVLALCYEVIARYVFNAPTIWAHETSCMLGGTIVALGWAYTHRHHGHVRVDVLYTHLSPRGKAIIDVFCALFLLFPLLAILIYTAADFMWVAWLKGEVLIESYWYPPSGPIRTVMLLGLSLFALQGAAQFIRDFYLLIRNKPL